MVRKSDEFLRPVGLSVKLPGQCAPLKPRFLPKSEKVSSYVMLCLDSEQNVSLGFYPLAI